MGNVDAMAADRPVVPDIFGAQTETLETVFDAFRSCVHASLEAYQQRVTVHYDTMNNGLSLCRETIIQALKTWRDLVVTEEVDKGTVVDLTGISQERQHAEACLLDYLLNHDGLTLPVIFEVDGEQHTVQKLDMHDSRQFDELWDSWTNAGWSTQHGRFEGTLRGENGREGIYERLCDMRDKFDAQIYVLRDNKGRLLGTVDVVPDCKPNSPPENRLTEVSYANLGAPLHRGLINRLMQVSLAHASVEEGNKSRRFYLYISSGNAPSQHFFSHLRNQLKALGIEVVSIDLDGDKEHFFTIDNPAHQNHPLAA